MNTNTNKENKPTPHPHAELIKAWSDGALIEYFDEGLNDWEQCLFNEPTWSKETKYRIKPEEPSARRKPEVGEEYSYFSDDGFLEWTLWNDTQTDIGRYGIYNCFRTKEEVEAAAERVKAALKGELVDKEEYERVCTQNKTLRHDLKEYQKGLEIIATNGLSELKKTAPSDENFQLDGKPLTDGEKALIRAFRNGRLCRQFSNGSSLIVEGHDKVPCCVTTHREFVAFFMHSPVQNGEVRNALEQIKAEQENNG